MSTPFDTCITTMTRDLGKYILDNQAREQATQGTCFNIRYVGHDPEVAQNKLVLAKNIIYTLQIINNDFQNDMNTISSLEDRPLRSKNIYDFHCKGFARVKNCINAGILTEKNSNERGTRAGMLAPRLQECLRSFEMDWENTKNFAWNSPTLQNYLFEYNKMNKNNVLKSFDEDLDKWCRRFQTCILTNVSNQTVAPPFIPQAPFAIAGADPFTDNLGKTLKAVL